MLRKISTILLAAMLLASCGSMTHERVTTVSFASYTDYPDMWISPNACTDPHTVLGEVIIDVIPATLTPQKNKDGVYASNINVIQWEKIGYGELLEMAVTEARARGANGISNFNVKYDRASDNNTILHYYVTGLLIRRE